MPGTRVVLDIDDFKALIRGKEIRKEGIRIVLSDIGFIFMAQEIRRAITDRSDDRSRQ